MLIGRWAPSVPIIFGLIVLIMVAIVCKLQRVSLVAISICSLINSMIHLPVEPVVVSLVVVVNGFVS